MPHEYGTKTTFIKKKKNLKIFSLLSLRGLSKFFEMQKALDLIPDENYEKKIFKNQMRLLL